MSVSLKVVGGCEQTHSQVVGQVNLTVINRNYTIGDNQAYFSADNTLDVQGITHLLCAWQDLAAELDLANAQCPTFAGVSCPGQVKPGQLPQGVESKATGHHGIANKMTGKKPKIGIDIQFSLNLTFAVAPPICIDFCYAVHHQHVADWKATGIRAE